MFTVVLTLSILGLAVGGAGAAVITWTGDGFANLWDTTSSNWDGGLSNYTDGDDVTFDNTGSVSPDVTLSTALSPGSITVNNVNDDFSMYNYVFSGTGSLAGSTGITKTGTGDLTINTANTFDGVVNISGGAVRLGNAAALGSTVGGTVVNGGTTVSPGGTLDLFGAKTLDEQITVQGVGVDGKGVLINTVSGTAIVNNLVLAGDATFGGSQRVDMRGAPSFSNYTLTVDHTAGTSSNNNGVRITGAGAPNTVALNHDLKNANVVQGGLAFHNSTLGQADGTITVTHNPNTTILTTLQIMRTIDLGANWTLDKNLVFTGGQLYNWRGWYTIDGTVTLNDMATTFLVNETGNSTQTIIAPAVTGTGGVTKTGPGPLYFLGNNTYAGTTTISAGNLHFGRTDTNTGSPGTTNFVLAGGNLRFSTNQAFTLGEVSGATGAVYYGADNAVLLDSLAVTVGSNSYDGATHVYKGAVILAANTGLGSTVGATTIYGGAANNGRVVLTNDITVGEEFSLTARYDPYLYAPHIVNESGSNTLTGNLTFISGGTHVTLQSDAGLLTVAGNITGTIGGKYLNLQGEGDAIVAGGILRHSDPVNLLHVHKLGTGTWTIGSAANTYNGNTVVGSGTLALGADAVISDSPLLDVQIDATFDVSAVTGGFTLAGTQTLMGNGSVVGNVLAATDSHVAPGASIGTLAIDGNLDLGGTLDVQYDSDTDTIDLLTVVGELDLTGATFSFSDLGSGSLAGGDYLFATYDILTGNPATYVGLQEGWSVNYNYGGTGDRIALVVPGGTDVPGDVNGDQKVDDADAKRLAAYWGATVKDPGLTWWQMGDFNGDNKVDARDASVLAANWGDHTGGESTAAVPEPSAIVMLLGAIGLFLTRRR
ncbi:MAG TPA: hypothetical protein DD670_19735 [Planctomycetaceae bacterium]|nr:hypothetical protein [Planctomycetaceae bacterium]